MLKTTTRFKVTLAVIAVTGSIVGLGANQIIQQSQIKDLQKNPHIIMKEIILKPTVTPTATPTASLKYVPFHATNAATPSTASK